MALSPCRECGTEVSNEALSCPRCGAPWPTTLEWRGSGFEWASQTKILGIPLVHVAFGRNQKGKRRVAKGIVAIGQFAIGLVTVAQFGIGILFGFGQFMIGLIVVAQFAGAIAFGVGQFALGFFAAGQFVLGMYGMGQAGWAKYLWSQKHVDMEAVAMFYTIQLKIRQFLGI
jgi:hypothetical protein